MFVAQLLTAVGFSSIFPFLPLYVQSLDSSSGLSLEFLAGMVYSGQAFTMMLASPAWGAVADRFGRKLMVERAMFGGAIILLLMAFVRSAEELVLLRAIQGLITGTIAAANALVASQVPRQSTGYAMGLLQVGSGTGIALGPVLGGMIADAMGYSAAFYLTAALLALGGLLVVFGVEENFTPPSSDERLRARGLLTDYLELLRTPGIAVTYAMRFLSQHGRMLILPVIPLFLLTLLPDSERANTITGMLSGSAAATTTISAVYLGRLGDRIGQRKILIACLLLAGLLYVPQALVATSWQLLAMQALVGVAMGGVIPSISALLARYSAMGREGEVYGLDNSVDAAGRSVAPLLGSGIALWFGLRATFIATALILILSAFLALWKLPEKSSVTG